MKAAIVTGINKLEIKEIPMPEVKAGGLLIKVFACAVCGSDVRIFEHGNPRVKYPAIIGHEISGEVVAVGSGVRNFKVGDRVAVGADVPCGKCDWCLSGMGNCCNDNFAVGYQFMGGFAQYCYLDPMVVSYGPIAKVPDNVDLEEAALSEPLACCLNGLERVFFNDKKSVLVVGAGPIGLLLIEAAKAFGSPLTILADIDSARLSLGDNAGSDHIIDSGKENLKHKIMEITKGRGVDVVFTACPSVEAQEQALELAAKRGFINFFGGLAASSRKINISSNLIHYNEIYLTGSHGSTPAQHKTALKLISEGRINVARLITNRFSLDNLAEAFEAIKNKKCLKVMINPWK